MALNAKILTPRQREVLEKMRAADDAKDYDNAEIVCDGGECWLGDEKLSRRTVDELVGMVLLSFDNLGGAEHYTLNGSARAALDDESVIMRIRAALATGTNVDDRGFPVPAPGAGRG